jgi:hypothetical protein
MIHPQCLGWRLMAAAHRVQQGAAFDENTATRVRLNPCARPALVAGALANAMLLQRLLHIAVLYKARRNGAVLADRTGGKRPASGRQAAARSRCLSLPSLMRMKNRLIVH